MHLPLFSLVLLPLVSAILPPSEAEYQKSALRNQQIPLFADIMNPDYTPLTNEKPTLADLLTIESSASIFYSYAREIETSRLFSDSNAKLTLLVPTNKAVMALARKPHQGPSEPDDGIITSEEEFDRQTKDNVERWVLAHIIPKSPISLEPQTYSTMLENKSVSFKASKSGNHDVPEWQRVVLEDDIHIINMREASNGVVYIIDGTINVD